MQLPMWSTHLEPGKCKIGACAKRLAGQEEAPLVPGASSFSSGSVPPLTAGSAPAALAAASAAVAFAAASSVAAPSSVSSSSAVALAVASLASSSFSFLLPVQFLRYPPV